MSKTCELGRPIQIIVCNDQYTTNGTAACARQAVEDKVLRYRVSIGPSPTPYTSLGIQADTIGHSPAAQRRDPVLVAQSAIRADRVAT